MSKVIRNRNVLALLRPVIGLKNSTLLVNQKTKTNHDSVTCVFPRFRQLVNFFLEFSLVSCDVFFVLIGRS